MTEYFALVWNRLNHAQSDAATAQRARFIRGRPRWRIVFDEPGLFVSTPVRMSSEIDKTYHLGSSGGVVLGRLFDRRYVEMENVEGASPPTEVFLDARTSETIVADAGHSLRDGYWGRYVAFLRNEALNKHWVLRDPTGQIPCQHIRVEGVSVYFVRLQDLEVIGPPPLSLNRHYFVGRLILKHFLTRETAYEAISTILPGERVEHFGSETARDFYWNPLAFAREHVDISSQQARIATRSVVRLSVNAWASCFERIALHLSGGVDSSIVAACLGTARPRPYVLGINWHAPVETSDERKFARAVAERWHFELEERLDEREGICFEATPIKTVTPDSALRVPVGWAAFCESLAQKGVVAQFRGDGGDELFYRGGDLPDAVDFAFLHGLQPRLWEIAMNDALIDATSVWTVLRSAVNHGMLKRGNELRRSGTYINEPMFCRDVRQEAAADCTQVHPLFQGDLNCAPAKARQAYSLLRHTMWSYIYQGTDAPVDIVRPLLSQPHMEFSLRTPLYVLRSGGRDRAMARAAFEGDVPASILNRKYKGLVTIPVERMVKQSLQKGRDLLMNGYLTEQRIVDKKYLDSMLALHGVSGYSVSAALKACIECEAWIQDAVGNGTRADLRASAKH